MTESMRALAATGLVVLPGALFLVAAERQVGRSGTADRLVTFVAASAVLHALAAPLTLWVYTRYLTTGRLVTPPIPWELWPIALAYVLVPAVAGSLTGAWVRRGGGPRGILPGAGPGPQAWDELFAAAAGRSAWVRIRLKDPSAPPPGWIYGVYAPASGRSPGSYASAFPYPADLFLHATYECDPSGRPLRNPDGSLRPRGYGVLVRWEEILYLEVAW